MRWMSSRVFPPGTLRFFNFSNTTPQVKFGGQVCQLTKGESTVVKSNVPDQGGLIVCFAKEPGSDGKGSDCQSCA